MTCGCMRGVFEMTCNCVIPLVHYSIMLVLNTHVCGQLPVLLKVYTITMCIWKNSIVIPTDVGGSVTNAGSSLL